MGASGGWTDEHILALAPNPSAASAAAELATAAHWRSVGGDDDAIWGVCLGSRPSSVEHGYDVVVDLATMVSRCTCPSRRRPCKHALGLLLRWVRREVPAAGRPAAVDRILASVPRPTASPPAGATGAGPVGDSSPGADHPPFDRSSLDRSRDGRIARTADGLADLARWMEDRMRTGLADPALARYETWDRLAARLVDARAGALAGRIRRIAGLVAVGADWHDRVLEELGILQLVVSGGQHIGTFAADAADLADAIAVAVGWQLKQTDVLDGVPETDDWTVAGRSDAREDRIDVRRWWLRGAASGRWAMVLAFAAHRESLDASFTVGEVIRADLHRYPGRSLRALVGRRFDAEDAAPSVAVGTVAAVCAEIGGTVAAEPWVDRVPAMVRAAPTVAAGRWVLTDRTGSLPVVDEGRSIAALLAASAGRPTDMTIEWTPWGVRPLAVHLADRVLDIGPRAGDRP